MIRGGRPIPRVPSILLGERRGGGTPSPQSLMAPPQDPRDLSRVAIKARERRHCTCPKLSVAVWSSGGACSRFFKMADPRRRVVGGGLRDLDSPVNERGLENMSVGYPEARVRLDDQPIPPTSQRNLDLKYLRRCRKTRLTHQSVNAFINNYCFIMSDEENCLRCGRRQKRVMEQKLERQFLPWIRDNLIDCLDEDQWPLETILFKALDDLLLDNFPKVRSDSCWQAITQCYRRIREMQRWIDKLEKQ